MQRDFQVDLHTSHSPIIACRCSTLEDLFCTDPHTKSSTTVVLYAVKRKIEIAGDGAAKPATVSKQQTYMVDSSWHPSIPQTTRGMAALLSSLYRLAQSIPLKGAVAEGKVLSMLYEITRFPPAVRTREFLSPITHTRSLFVEPLAFEQWVSYS